MFFPEIVKKLKDNDPQLRVVNLESHSLSPENVQPMAEALNKNSHLTLLNLKNNNLRDEGASLLARALTVSEMNNNRSNFNKNNLVIPATIYSTFIEVSISASISLPTSRAQKISKSDLVARETDS
jgi:Ran GTPase-activating protein (RanGAP) involved in mRNA processing and transport